MTNRVYAKSSFFASVPNIDGKPIVVEVPSKSNPDKNYKVDLTHGRCSCPAWVFQKGGGRKPCKHLIELGYKEVSEPVEVKEAVIAPATVEIYEGEL